VLQPASTTVTAITAPRYAPISARDFLLDRLRANGVYDADPAQQIS
jgi:hypothetical protein